MKALLETNFRDLLKMNAAGGILLMAAAVAAMIIANSPAAPVYDLLLNMPVEVRVGAIEVAKPLLLWINDGLMAVFFFLVGLELKRELLEGSLRERETITLPLFGAMGGMAAPALIYVAFNWGDADALSGWAIPAATDIAFALGVLSLLGNRVPVSLKVFLVSLAIIDDIGAIIIIALFYTSEVSASALAIVFPCLFMLYVMNRRNVISVAPYVLVGIVMWLAVLKSGVHATLAGVLLAMFIPMRDRTNTAHSPLTALEDDLHGVVAFGILPIFAFANSGISLDGIGWDAVLHPVPLGIAAGLFLGNQLGIFSICWVAVKLGLAKLPADINWKQLYGTGMLCGVGFTMSLFIGSLAFDESGVDMFFDERLGIMGGSLLSAVFGYCVLYLTLPPHQAAVGAREKVAVATSIPAP